MNELALFAGGCGGILGSRLLGWRTVCYVENDAYCVKVIRARIGDGYLDDAPIWDDVRTFDGRPWAGLVDVLSAGFPCQPFSVAGRGLAELDDRNLWPDTIRIARESQAEWLLLENVPGLFSKPYIRRIFADLAQSGFDVRWDRFSAAGVGAPHIRARQWLVAHSKSNARGLSNLAWQEGAESRRIGEVVAHTESQRRDHGSTQDERSTGGESDASGDGGPVLANTLDIGRERNWRARRGNDGSKDGGSAVADTIAARLERPELIGPRAEGQGTQGPTTERATRPGNYWTTEPELGRVADGVANRVDRLRAIGNGQVPAVVRRAWRDLSA